MSEPDADSIFGSPPKSIPDINDHCSDDNDDDLPSAITCKTPMKTPKTEPSTQLTGTANLGVTTLSPLKLSPMKSDSRFVEERMTVTRLNKLAKPVYETVNAINQSQAIHCKVGSIMHDHGGIRAMSQQVYDKMEEKVDSPDCPSPSSIDPKVSIDKITIHLPVFPPGEPLFTAPPTLMEDIGSPSVGGAPGLPPFLVNAMSHGGSDMILRELLVGQRLAILFSSRPCPREIVMWLLEVSCLSGEDVLRMSAFYCLCQLLRTSPVTITPQDICKIVTSLGSLGETDAKYVHSSRDRFLVAQGVSRVLQFLQHSVRRCPYNMEQTKELFGLVLRLALDPLVCQCTVCIDTPIGDTLAALEGSITNEEDWAAIKSHVLVLANSLTTHHHNRLYIVELFACSSQRMKQLQRELLKQALCNIVGGANNIATDEAEESMEVENERQTTSQHPPSINSLHNISDTNLARNVLLRYFKIANADIDYYEAHSVLKLLATLIRRPDFHWENKDAKKDFVRLLSDFNSWKMRDNAMELERGPVKDLVIRLKLELQEERGGLRQTDLFSYF